MTLIGVGGNSGTDEDEYAAFVDSTGTGGMTHVFDPSGDIWGSYRVFSQPAWAFINDDGTVSTQTRSFGKDEILEEAQKLADS